VQYGNVSLYFYVDYFYFNLHFNILFALSFYLHICCLLYVRDIQLYPLWTILIPIIIIIIIIIYFPSIDPYRITKSKWIWKSSHFRENKEYNHYKVYINNKAQYNI